MSTIKTRIATDIVINFLKDNLDASISSINFLKGGEMSQAFSFTTNGQDLVIRIFNKSYSFEKDKYAYEHFKSSLIPIPKILEVGKFNENYFYAISELAPGYTVDKLTIEQRTKLLPQLIAIHDAIRNTKIVGKGYGYWDKEGNAKFSSWKEYILNSKDDVFNNWEKLYKKTFLEKDVVEKVSQKIKQLVEFIPEERYLVHGDYGGNNMTSDGRKITGVLDWGESKYGDFMFDVSWLTFYFEDIPYPEIFDKHYREIGLDVKNFKERLLCYELHLGLGGIGFFALSGQKEPYEWGKNKLLKLIEEI